MLCNSIYRLAAGALMVCINKQELPQQRQPTSSPNLLPIWRKGRAGNIKVPTFRRTFGPGSPRQGTNGFSRLVEKSWVWSALVNVDTGEGEGCAPGQFLDGNSLAACLLACILASIPKSFERRSHGQAVGRQPTGTPTWTSMQSCTFGINWIQ